jgi:hypothetical protein
VGSTVSRFVAGRDRLLILAEHFTGCRIHEMEPPARQTGDRLIGVVRHFLGDKSLYGLAGVRAAVKKRRHPNAPKANF